MTNEAIDSKLANQFASSHSEEVAAMKEKFRVLNESAHTNARLISANSDLLNDAWQEFLPILNKMQLLLSQRGSARGTEREAGLPKWGPWFEAFQNETGLKVSIRSVQKHLAVFRGIVNEKRPRPERRVKLPSVDQVPPPQAPVLGGAEFAAALDSGAPFQDALREHILTAVEPKYVEQLLAAIPTKPPEVFTAPVREAVPVDIPKQALPLSQRLPMPSRGDWSGLFNSVSDLCGMRIKAALDGLQPEQMADIFGKFVQKLAKTYCRIDNQAVKIQVTVEVVNRNSSPQKAA